MSRMDSEEETQRVVGAGRDIAARAAVIFELIAEPTQQLRSDDDRRIARAKATTSERLQASLDRLAAIAED